MIAPGHDTPTVAVLTPRGRAAVAVVSARIAPERIDAAPPLFRAANGRPLAAQPENRVCFGRWGSEAGEDVVVCRIDADVTEISCHGGIAAVERIVRDLAARGCRAIDWSEALRDGRSFIEAECLTALMQTTTLRTASIVLEQSSGVLERALAALLSAPPDALVAQIHELLRWADFGLHFTTPWRVVLAGLPNVGKSSLINRLVGYQRSIVYSEPGTTRDIVTAAAVFDGWPVELADTAGLRERAGEIESLGIERARRQLAAADVPVIVLDCSRPIAAEEARLLNEFPRALVVAHKCDLACVWRPGGAIPVSSLTGEGLKALTAEIVTRLVPEVPPSGTALPVTLRQRDCLIAARRAAAARNQPAAREWVRNCLNGPDADRAR